MPVVDLPLDSLGLVELIVKCEELSGTAISCIEGGSTLRMLLV
jgi:acyl carrier protein